MMVTTQAGILGRKKVREKEGLLSSQAFAILCYRVRTHAINAADQDLTL